MQLRYQKTILAPAEYINKVTSLTWTPNNSKLAAVTTDKVVYLFDENGDRRDKFKTKPAEATGPQSYLVRAMAFSPDSSKLAIAQSDNIVFVYRLGAEWSDKKSICNKFLQSSPVTCLVWPKDRNNEVVFGLSDGKVKLGMLKTNKPYTMYTHPESSYVVSLASSPNGNAVIGGHLDGSIIKFTFPEDGGAGLGHQQLVIHSCVPYALGWGNCIAAAGNDNRVVFYDLNGKELQYFDYSTDDNVREFSACAFNPSGDVVVFGCFGRFYIYCYNILRGMWDEVGCKQIENFYSITALAWKPDGSKLIVGSLTGAVDVYDACVKRYKYKGKFEFTYVSKSSVIVKTLKTGQRTALKSVYGYEIEKINIYHNDRFIVARTQETMLLGDLETCKLSEVQWQGDGTEKFYFENEKVCMIYQHGELLLVEYGRNEVLGMCRTEHMSPYLLSVVVLDKRGIAAESKKIAYLMDLQTVRIQDLVTNQTLATVNHDVKVDWLELNTRGTHLLFRDKKRHLHLFNMAKQERVTLLNYCQYVQWVPGSDVVVAQSRSNLCVWYSINTPDRQTTFPIKGDVEDIERNHHRTEVIVDEGINTVSYALDEALIDFGSALEDQDFERAVAILEPLELTPETEAHWRQLAELALEHNQIVIAERCYAALGDIPKSRYLHKVVKLAEQAAKETGGDGYNSYVVRAKLAQLAKQWPVAESLLLNQGRGNEAIAMYQQAHRWEDAIRVAESLRHPDTASLKHQHYDWLLETNQEEKAGLVKEREGDVVGAISLYLKGGLPGRAAQVVMSSNFRSDPALLEAIISSLTKAGLYEKHGELLEHLGRMNEAQQAYRRGHTYRRAVELARRESPGEVIRIEEEWGDWLMGQKQMDAAINHFIEAGNSVKAIEAALQCRQFVKAAGIVEFLEPNKAMPYYKCIAQHYEAVNNYEEAERYYIKADMAFDAVDMYSRVGRWDAASRVARGYLTDSEMHAFYRKKGREFEAQHKYKEAEKAYVQAEEYDAAISMYRKARNYDQMIRMVQHYRKDNLVQAHLLVAQQLESEGNLKEAEKHYVDAKDWKSAVQMHRAHDNWEDALRVAKVYGGINASKQVAYAWAITLGGEEGATLLKKLGLIDQAIDYAIESGAFAQAFELTRAGMKQKLPEVHLKYAMYLEDEGRFAEAEQEFINAGKSKEAIDMYVHNQDWEAAMRVAEQHDPTSIADVLIAQARVLTERKQFNVAEAVYLKAKRPELALKMYRDARMWHDALRLAEDYLPSKVQEIHLELASNMGGSGGGQGPAGSDTVLNKAKAYERGNDYARAIETYLSLSTRDTNNLDALEQCWEQAASLAMKYQRHRAHEVVSEVCKRLMDIQRYESAASLYESIDDAKGAIQAYCAGGMFDQARQVAAGNPTFNRFIEEKYTAHLVESKAADELANRGMNAQAIDMFVQRNEWQKVHELAAKQGAQVAAMYALRHAQLKWKQREFGAAAEVFAQHGIVADPANFQMYHTIALEVLGAPAEDCDENHELSLKEMLFRLWQQLEGNNNVKKVELEDFKRLYWAAHYVALSNQCRKAGLKEMAAKQLTTALRYVGIIPADKAFFKAGMAWKDAGRLNMAFVMLNRFLDLSDAMEDPDNGNVIENADFVDTDIPYDFHLPPRPHLDYDRREEVRNMVLEMSMDQQVEQSLSLRTCEQCGVETYEANLTCHSCKNKWEQCAVSGYPIPPGEKVVNRGSTPEVVARRDDWNQYISTFQVDPVTGQMGSPMY